MDAIEGLFLGSLAVIIMVAVFALGTVQKKTEIVDACETVGAFEFQGAVYDCKRRVVGN